MKIFKNDKLIDCKFIAKMIKISLLFVSFFLFTMNCMANSYSESVRLNVKIDNPNLKDAIVEIKKQTDFDFLYSKDIEPLYQANAHIEIKEGTIEEVLNQLFKNSRINYQIIDKTIVLTAAKVENTNTALQGISVSGTVTDNNGPLPGVNVVVKGTLIGQITDNNGKYTVNVPNSDATLIFSFVGYATQEFVVGAQRTIDVTMSEDANIIEEVVVIGYGTARKRDLTGSVARINTEEYKTRSMSQMTEMLVGKVAGLNMSQGTSAAGGADNLQLRGATSIAAGASPMIVLDGVIFSGSIRDINPMDIVSIDVMKDASSAAIFGSNAGSGVILVTTNRGELGRKPTISVSAKIGMAEDYRKFTPRKVDEYLQFRSDAYRAGTPGAPANYETDPDKLTGMTVDEWMKLRPAATGDPKREWFTRIGVSPGEADNYFEGKIWDTYHDIFRKGLRQDYDLSINGGSSNATYYWSVGYNDYKGIRVGDQYSVLRTRLNVDFTVTKWLNAGVNAQFSHRDEFPSETTAYPIPPVDASNQARDGYWGQSPLGTPIGPDGFINRLPNGHTAHPLIDYYRSDLLSLRNNLFASFYASIKLPFGINYRISYQPRYETRQLYEFYKVGREVGVTDPLAQPEGRRRDYFWMNWMVDNVLSWKYVAGGHNFDVTLVANAEKNQSWYNSMGNKNFSPTQALGYHGLNSGTDKALYYDVSDSKSTGAAYAARLNYHYKGKYLLNATIRRDGYSAFGQDNPWATFPAVGVGWMISEEDFFKFDFINRLKLRVSYGSNGNRNIGGYQALASLNASESWYDGQSVKTAIWAGSLSNRSLKWETITTLNPGFDLVLLKNRIDFSFDLYQIKTTNLLLWRKLPRITGYDSVMANVGQLDNFGVDFTLRTVNIKNNNINWTSHFTFSMNRNKLINLYDEVGTYRLLNQEMTGQLPDVQNNRFIGQPLDVVWNYKVLGIWQTEEKEEAYKYRLYPGDYKVEDVERKIVNAGTANEKYALEQLKDKQFIGYTQPRYRLGFSNDVTFLKNFTASIFLWAQLGHIGSHAAAYWNDSQFTLRNRTCSPGPYWTAARPHKEYPRIQPDQNQYGGGLAIYKPRSYLRVQDVSLTYNMPNEITRLIGMNSFQVYGSVRNLLTFSKWPGWDPESGATPMPRIWTLGVNFTL